MYMHVACVLFRSYVPRRMPPPVMEHADGAAAPDGR